MSGVFESVPAGTLRSIAGALRSGQLTTPLSRLGLSLIAGSLPDAVVAELLRLSSEGIAPQHLALLMDAKAETTECRLSSAAELVWTGPESAVAHSRDTAVVLSELFRSASQSVLVSTMVVHQGGKVFATLAQRMTDVPQLRVQLFVHVERARGDTRLEAEIVRDYANRFKSEWPGPVRPTVYYAPSSLSVDPKQKATWHAKAVVIDESTAFVTSANFTEWAQQRNVEAGVIVRNSSFARQLRHQFDSLVHQQVVLELPGFR